MRDPIEQLGVIARELAGAEVSPAVQAQGRQRLVATAAARMPLAHSRKPIVVWALACAATLILVLGIVQYRRSQPIGYSLSGGAAFRGDYLSAATDRPAKVRFTDGSELSVEPGSRLRVGERRNNGARIFIERGGTTANVHHGERSSWQFVAGPFTVHVVGTRLSLAWDPVREEVDVLLHEGAVEIESPLTNGRVAVHGGQRFRASLLDGSLRVENLTERAAQKAEPAADAASATPIPSAASVTHEPALPAETSAKSRSRTRTAPSAERASDNASESWPELVRRGEFRAVVTAAEARGIGACLASCTAAELRAAADAARYLGNAELAEKSLRALRQRFGSRGPAAAAAFLLGRMSESAGRLADADRWYRTYLSETSSGEFAADALAGRMRVTSAREGRAAARPLALEYLRKYPNGVQAPAAKKLGAGE